MNENMTNNYEFEGANAVEVYEDQPKTINGKTVGLIAGGVAAAIGGIALLCHLFKDKINASRAKKLEKAGYIVIKPEEAQVEVVED